MKDSNYANLLKLFQKIKERNYIKSVNNNKNGAGITLEHLLNAGADNLWYPDYNGIELKALRFWKDANCELFNLTPDSNHLYTTKWLSNNYGYPDRAFPDRKVFKGDVYANKFNKIGLFNYYKLSVDHKQKKIFLEIYNYRYILIDKSIYWDFSDLEKRLTIKLNKLALFDTKRKVIDGYYYFKYINLKLYILKSFDIFLQLIEEGYIFITFKTGIVKSGNHRGEFNDHGTAFKISKPNLHLLFNDVTRLVEHNND